MTRKTKEDFFIVVLSFAIYACSFNINLRIINRTAPSLRRKRRLLQYDLEILDVYTGICCLCLHNRSRDTCNRANLESDFVIRYAFSTIDAFYSSAHFGEQLITCHICSGTNIPGYPFNRDSIRRDLQQSMRHRPECCVCVRARMYACVRMCEVTRAFAVF